MKKVNLILAALLIGLMSTTILTSCKKEGCTDPKANNYDADTKKDDGSCTYPTVSVNPGGDDGDVTGSGGSATSTHTWYNSQSKAELNMDITAGDGGSFQVIVDDADGNEVLNETLEVGVGDDSKTACSTSGTSGTWTVTVKLTDFDGDGSFTLQQGC